MPGRKPRYFMLKSMITTMLHNVRRKLHHGILFDRRLEVQDKTKWPNPGHTLYLVQLIFEEYDMDASSLSMGCNFYLQYVFPKTIHTSPTEGIFSKTSYKFQIRLIHFFKCFGLRKPHPPGNSNPSCGGSMDIFWNCALNLDKRLCMLIFSYDSFCHATSFSSLIQFLS